MAGMNRNTGKPIDGDERLAQRIADVLTTPLGSRVMLRDYGSRLLQLTDRPATPPLAIQVYAATAEAIMRWLSDAIRLTRVQLHLGDRPGAYRLALQGVRFDLPTGPAPFTLSVPLQVAAGGLVSA